MDQVAGLYDTETKTMCIPSFQNTNQPAGQTTKAAARKKMEEIPGSDVAIVFAHEYTRWLDDQYWPLDEPKDKDAETSTDHDDARSFLFEGSATRLMIEALPRGNRTPATGHLRHGLEPPSLGLAEAVLDFFLSRLWKGPEAEVPGVPEALVSSRDHALLVRVFFLPPDSARLGPRRVGLLYDHPPVSTEQVMHPQKCWEWRDFPVRISLPETLPGGWKRRIDDTIGEAGIAVLLGCQLKNLNRGERLACGWDGDRVALYEAPDGRKLLAWASSWDSPAAAERFSQSVCRGPNRGPRCVHHLEERRVSRLDASRWPCRIGSVEPEPRPHLRDRPARVS